MQARQLAMSYMTYFAAESASDSAWEESISPRIWRILFLQASHLPWLHCRTTHTMTTVLVRRAPALRCRTV